jgi:hypothetical protein
VKDEARTLVFESLMNAKLAKSAKKVSKKSQQKKSAKVSKSYLPVLDQTWRRKAR